jgi:putative DNA methylase
MSHPIKSPRKLIEVALPLDAINEACAYEKMPGIGAHPRGMHLWWARRPLAAARAVIFAQLVNDPGYQQGGGFKYGRNIKDAAVERKRLFAIIEDLVKWENSTNEEVLERARVEIRRSWREVCELNKDHPQSSELFNPDRLPAFHDPFAGGGAIPLEAQRLGLETYASDLNPVAVLINKAMIEIPPKFAERQPVSITVQKAKGFNRDLGFAQNWPGATGLAQDIQYYGDWIQSEAQKRIGHLYPPIEITSAIAKDRPDLKVLIGQKLDGIAWLWARTVKSPNPAFSQVDVPLAATFVLSTKKGKTAYVQPVIDGDQYRFTVKLGTPTPEAKKGSKANGRGANFRCIMSDSPISADYIRTEAQAGRMGQRLMAVVVGGARGRLYLSPTPEIEAVALSESPSWKPDVAFCQQALGFRVGNYGMTKWSDLFTSRQLVGLTTFCDLVGEARDLIRQDAVAAGVSDDGVGLDSNGTGATAYAEAVSVYLAFAISRLADFGCTLATWKPSGEQVMHLFTRGAIPMAWDFPESNFLGESAICWKNAVKYTFQGLRAGEATSGKTNGNVSQADAQSQAISSGKIVSTDPPYYDNIGYADLSDFFYVWLRNVLRPVFSDLLATIVVPKSEELVATPFRHGSDEKAELFFLDGMTHVIQNLARLAHPEGPVTIYYAFKQAETDEGAGTSSTGWETFIMAVLRAGFAIVGTWPLRSEQEFRMRGMGSNALASSIVLVCRKRSILAPTVSRREFLRELNTVLPAALEEMTKGAGGEHSPVAPVDLSQAIIGPGIAVFSKYTAVLEADGSPMGIRTALQLINRFLAEDDFDADTQFCLHWFDQHGWETGTFGEADTLARAKGTSVDGVKQAGVLHATGGNVRLLKWAEYPRDWDPKSDQRLPIWEVLHQLIRVFKTDGETGAAAVFAAVQSKAEAARQLAYRLYTLCERKNWAEDARAYNEVVTSWSGIESAAATKPAMKQGELF